ncbi:calcium/sodium antiporter [Motiliproteus coralliicola]|uniref:Calcium/sodium antiporter n=2 Tax=Motiliproteus coralliicola TaxID=2283196 RepID=A0A369WD70_9GAMM|nr:calcium/sodium antiporter [Motiliproteus coralliicola]RDE19978.1 calcium/sodium antiporter [Motiliproteus coralliicola]
MAFAVAALLAGFIILIWSADRFVMGAAATAKNLGMSPMLIGLTVVSLGTSAPEMLVSGFAAYTDAGGLAIGNALGSNIANIGLVLGATALIAPLPVKTGLMRKELPLLLIISIGAGLILMDQRLGLVDSLLLISALVVTLYLFSRFQKSADPEEIEHEEEELPDLALKPALFWLILGLVLLAGSSRLLVWGATEIAVAMGVSDLVIGLTIVAIGTSLPELAASVASALKGHHDIAIGNVVGSNIFNLLAVMSLPGLIQPIDFEATVLWRDYGAMMLFTLSLLAFAYILERGKINRLEGSMLLAGYSGYLGLLYYMASA